MKKIYLLIVMLTQLFLVESLNAQCYTAPNGLWPTATFTPTCTGAFQNITTSGFAGEYSNVNLVAGTTYTFRSSVTTDYITVDNNGAAPLVGVVGVSGTAGITWTCTVTGTYRFYTHTSSACGASTASRTRSILCAGAAFNPCTTIPTLTCGAAATNYSMAASAGAWNAYGGAYGVPGQEKLFQFTPAATGSYAVTMSSTGWNDFYWKAASVGCNATGWTYVNDILGTETWNVTLTAGVTYYLMLDDEDILANTGTIRVACLAAAVAPANDACAAATSLPCGTSGLAGTTVNTVSETAPSGCASNFGVWYTFTGDGQQTTITSTTAFDHELTIVSGACGAFTNIACVDNSTGTETYTFNTVNGTVYRVYVAHFLPGSTTTGTFTMSRTCTPLTYDPCASIPTISGCGTSATASMTGAGAGWSPGNCGFTTPGQERLFSFTAPTTGTYTLNVSAITGGYVDFFWKPASGGCNATGWNCIDDIFGAGTYNAITPMTFTAGTTYYILLDPEGTGTYSATFNMVCPVAAPANDLVCNAASITCGGTVSGTTVGAGNAGTGENQTCGTGQTMGGVWYVVAGNGQTMTASLCATVWDSKISVFSGTNCSTLTCIGGNDDNGPACAGASASYSWPSVVGQNYYILVHGFIANSAFSINLSCVTPTPPPANDNCANAQSVTIQCPVGATAISGTTANATEEAMADPSCDPGTIRDVWYTFNSGNNTSVNLSVTLGTADWLGGEIHTTCGNPAPGLTIGGNAGNCDYHLLDPAPTSITGLTPNTTYRLRLFSNVDWDIAGSFTFTLTNSQNNPGAVSVPASICVGTATSISNVTAATGAPGSVNYSFYYRGGPSNVIWQMYDGPTTNASSALPAAVINTPGTWFIARNSDFGCGQANNATTLDLQIIVNEASTAPALSGTSPVCPATSVVLNATGGTASPGSSINWYTGPNGTGSLLGAGSSYTVTPSATSTYYARREGGCNTTSDGTYTITVNGPTGITPTNTDMVWRGATNDDWATLGNWWQYNGTAYGAATAAPTAAQNVIIPAAGTTCVSNQPNTLANSGTANNLTIEAGATLTMQSGTLNVSGNWVNNGNFVPGSGTVAFTGMTNTTIGGSAASNNFNNVEMNKSGEALLVSPATIAGSLTLTNGNLNIAGYTLNMGSQAINDGSPASFVKTSGAGTLKRSVSGTTTLFPVGLASYNPVELTKAGSNHTFAVSVYDTVKVNGLNNGIASTGANVGRMWHITPDAGYVGNAANSVTVSLIYNDNGGYFRNGFINDQADRNIFHYGQTWENITNNPVADLYTSIANYSYLSQSGVFNFSPFTIANFNTVLPIELTSFQANCAGDNKVNVTWSTASEHNTSHFIVEKSRDGNNWTALGVVNAAGNSTSMINYSLADENAGAEITYYRLTQYDNDGVFEVFNAVSTNCGNESKMEEITVYPNPSNGEFIIDLFTEELTGEAIITITDSKGVIVKNLPVFVIKGSNTFHVNGLEAAPGMYYIQVSNGTTTSNIVKHSLR